MAIDVDRVFDLYRVPGALKTDVAFSLGIRVSEVDNALRRRARRERAVCQRHMKFEKIATGFCFGKHADGSYIDARTSGAFQMFCQLR